MQCIQKYPYSIPVYALLRLEMIKAGSMVSASLTTDEGIRQ